MALLASRIFLLVCSLVNMGFCIWHLKTVKAYRELIEKIRVEKVQWLRDESLWATALLSGLYKMPNAVGDGSDCPYHSRYCPYRG